MVRRARRIGADFRSFTRPSASVFLSLPVMLAFAASAGKCATILMVSWPSCEMLFQPLIDSQSAMPQPPPLEPLPPMRHLRIFECTAVVQCCSAPNLSADQHLMGVEVTRHYLGVVRRVGCTPSGDINY